MNVNLLGLNVTTSNINAALTATTGDGQVLGNLLYNVANLANPDGPAALLEPAQPAGHRHHPDGGAPSSAAAPDRTLAPQQLLQVNLKPLDINLLGLEVQSDPITVTISTQGGDGKLLGNVLSRRHARWSTSRA